MNVRFHLYSEYNNETKLNILTAGNIKRMTQDQRHAYGYTGWSLDTAKDNLDPDYTPSSIQVQTRLVVLINIPTTIANVGFW